MHYLNIDHDVESDYIQYFFLGNMSISIFYFNLKKMHHKVELVDQNTFVSR